MTKFNYFPYQIYFFTYIFTFNKDCLIKIGIVFFEGWRQ